MAYFRRLPSGKWQATVRVSKTKRVTATRLLKEEAKAWAREQETAIHRGDWRDPRLARIPFEDWFERWWAARVLEPEGERNARYLADKHVLPYWRGKTLASIGRIDVQAWVAKMQKQGKGAPTVNKAYGIFRGCLNAAADEELISRSPCRNITLPTIARTKPKYYEVSQVETLVAELPAHHAAVALLMAWSGLRWEEAAAVQVDQVNALRRELTVSQVVTEMRRIKGYPKGAAEHRVVPLPDHVLAALTPFWQKAVEAEPYVQGEGKAATRHQLLFRARDGRPPNNRTWGKCWRELHDRLEARGAGVPRFSPHTLRHTAASWWVQNGVDLYQVAELLGHSDPAMSKRYAHLRPGVHRGVREAWAALLGAESDAGAPGTHASPL